MQLECQTMRGTEHPARDKNLTRALIWLKGFRWIQARLQTKTRRDDSGHCSNKG